MARERESESSSSVPQSDGGHPSTGTSPHDGDDPVIDLSDAAATEGNRLTAFDLRLTQVDRRLTDLADESDRRRHEIDVLQEALSEGTGPLRKRPTFLAEALSAVAAFAAVVVAVLAVIIQRGALDYQREVDARQQARELRADARQQERELQEDRADLRGILQGLTALTAQEAGTEGVSRQRVLGDLNSQRRVLIGQAVGLVESLRNKGTTSVTSSEYSTLGQALHQIGEHELARGYYGDAAKSATTYVDALHAVRSEAILDHAMGLQEQGRRRFAAALQLREEYADRVLPFHLDFWDIETHHAWAEAEIGLARCDMARTQLNEAQELAASRNLTEWPDIKQRHDALTQQVNENCDPAAASVSGQ